MATPPSTRTWIGLPRADAVAVISLVAIAVVMFGVPALLGHPQAPGDDAIQNFPLRVLAGRQLAHGHLPVFDPYIWGGAPLLAGWNAGALYPFTFLFALLSPNGAWAINEMIVYIVASVGLYAFLRALPLASVPSALGAATFAFAGAMDVHLAHFGLVAGMSWIPLILLAMVKLSRHTTPVGRALWIALLALSGGLSVLAGEPRAIDTVVIVSLIYFLWIVVRMRRQAGPFIVSVGTGAVLAVLIGAVQWLPGAMAVATSQRSNDTFSLFASGSLSPRWLLLALVPGLFGGSGSFGTAAWFTSYNLPEVMGYVGLLPLVGAFALLGTLRRRRPLPDWIVWHAMAVIGGVLAVGSFTPLGHVLASIPLFGGQRLQSRNIAVTDLALAVLLAYWADRVLRRQTDDDDASHRSVAWSRALALLPLGAAGLLAVVAIAGPVTVANSLGATGSRIGHAMAQRPLSIFWLVLIVATAAIVITVGRLSPSRRALVLVSVVLVDLVAFNTTDVWTIAPGLGHAAAPAPDHYPTGTSPTELTAPTGTGTTGRFAMYDPNGFIDNDLRALSSPDLNVLNQLFSVQGYSSIVYGPYAGATGSHAAQGKGNNALDPAAIGDGLLDQLDATTLLTSPRYLVRPADADGASPTATAGTPRGPGTRDLRPGEKARWSFGETILVSDIALPWVPDGDSGSSVSWRVGLEEKGGGVLWQPVTATSSAGTVDIALAHPAPAVGLVITVAGAAGVAGAPVVATGQGAAYATDGALADAVTARWVFEGDRGGVAYFSNRHPSAPLTLRIPDGSSPAGGTVRVLSGPHLEPASATVDSPQAAEVVRAVAMIPGWTATWTPAGGGSTTALTVHRLGLVQAVEVPGGRGVVTWVYRAPGLTAGLVLSIAGVVLWLAVVAGALVVRRRRRAGGSRRLRMAREMVPN
jgi:hypothetical protein